MELANICRQVGIVCNLVAVIVKLIDLLLGKPVIVVADLMMADTTPVKDLVNIHGRVMPAQIICIISKYSTVVKWNF